MLVFIIIGAAAIRLFQLGVVPHGFTWDEAAIGYNGYAVVTTRRDEWLERLPVSFRSFGDYKAPLAIYANGLFTATLGLSPFVVRLPFALSGIVAIALIYWVLYELFTHYSLAEPKKMALLGAGMLALSPWHILYSRTGFESGIALSFLLAMVGCFLLGLRKKNTFLVVLSGVSGVAAMYTYHSAKLAVPLLGVVMLIFWLESLKKNVRPALLALAAVVILLIPMVKDSIVGSGLERAGVTVFSRETSILSALATSGAQLGTHLSPSFLLLGETTTLRHGTGVWGVLLLTTYISGLFALGYVIWGKPTKGERRLSLFFILWIVLGLLPASIATEVPHSNRALLALPGFIGLALMGLHGAITLAKVAYVKKMLFGTAICLYILFAAAFLHHYFFVYSAQSSTDFYDGYLDAFSVAQEYEKGLNGKPKVDTIFVTSEYGQPYIYALFVRKTNPIWYQGGSLSEKYSFLEELTPGDLSRSNVLLVAGPERISETIEPTQVILGSDGAVRFNLYYRPPQLAE